MKKTVTTIIMTTIMFACNNAPETNATTQTTGTDTVQTDTLPPPPAIMPDTAALQTDSAKVKRAMRK